MKNEIQWLVHLGVERGLVTQAVCRELAKQLGSESEIVDFAQALLETDSPPDFDALQELMEEAWEEAQDRPSPVNPFETVEADTAPADEPRAETPPPVTAGGGDFPDFGTTGNLDAGGAQAFLKTVLLECQRRKYSDLHLSASSRPFARVNRTVHYLSDEIISPAASATLNTALLSAAQAEEFERQSDLDYALVLDANHRFRVNLMVHKEGVAGTYRIVPDEVKSLEELGFDNADTLRKLLAYHNGLILLTGPVGSGKTLTLAAMIDELNRTRQDHLITVEAPIEIVQRSQECQITQREVGSHTKTFKSALKGALRQDPDIIVIGEMRDLETIEIAISASETGHLVIGTLHTRDAANTLNRVLDVFPAAQQTQIRAMVSESLRGIVCQRLLPSTGGGLVLAYELLLNNTAVANLIRENKPEGLVNVMETGSGEGMRLMDKSIKKLLDEGRIDRETALANINNRMLREQARNPSAAAGAAAAQGTAPKR